VCVCIQQSPKQTILISQQLLIIDVIYNETWKEQCYNPIRMVHQD